jgi:hypothetical protein
MEGRGGGEAQGVADPKNTIVTYLFSLKILHLGGIITRIFFSWGGCNVKPGQIWS